MFSFSLVYIKLREVINNYKKNESLKFFRPPLKFRPKNKLGLKCHTQIGVGLGLDRGWVGDGPWLGWGWGWVWVQVQIQVWFRFREMEKKPINYFKLVLDPVCFGTSMFCVSFLVEEGKMDISVCEEIGLAMIVPLSRKNKGGHEE